MVNSTPSRDTIKDNVESAVRPAGPWVEKLARAGYVAKGIVYVVIGMLALQAAFSAGGETTNSSGALETIVAQPFGRLLLGLVGIGLAGYALWRFVAAAIDAERDGTDAKGIAKRIGYVISGISYSLLAYTALQLIRGNGNAGGESSTQDGTARLLAAPFGQGLVAIVGLIVIGHGLTQVVKGYKADFVKKMNFEDVDPAQKKTAVMSGRWGYIARGIVFAITGGFLLNAARSADPKQAKGLGSALDLLAGTTVRPLDFGCRRGRFGFLRRLYVRRGPVPPYCGLNGV
jgi:hypothetical protein